MAKIKAHEVRVVVREQEVDEDGVVETINETVKEKVLDGHTYYVDEKELTSHDKAIEKAVEIETNNE